MQKKEYYSIGEASDLCHISKKTLRFYDKIGIISPDKISPENLYRFYERKTLLSVPIIKYYKQMGFKLEEMKEAMDGNTYDVCEKSFRNKIEELTKIKDEIFIMHTSVKDWYDLILEAKNVIENRVNEVAVKYIDCSDYCFMEQSFDYDFMALIINIEWTNYIESIENAITGPVIIYFPSFEDRISGKSDTVRIVQKTIRECKPSQTMKLGGYIVASCYHIGSHESIDSAYEKIRRWARAHGYELGVESYERYVTDYWTTSHQEQFVTEIMVKLLRK